MLRALLRNRTLLANTWAFFVFGYFLFFFMTWLPSSLEHAYGLKLRTVGLFTVLPWLAAAVVLDSLRGSPIRLEYPLVEDEVARGQRTQIVQAHGARSRSARRLTEALG